VILLSVLGKVVILCCSWIVDDAWKWRFGMYVFRLRERNIGYVLVFFDV